MQQHFYYLEITSKADWYKKCENISKLFRRFLNSGGHHPATPVATFAMFAQMFSSRLFTRLWGTRQAARPQSVGVSETQRIIICIYRRQKLIFQDFFATGS